MEPCSLCAQRNRRCVVDTGLSKCSECIQAKVSCNALEDDWDRHVPRESEWESLDKEEERLEDEEEAAAARAQQYVFQAQEAMARVAELRAQRSALKKRKRDMTRRGLCYLEELDAAEATEGEERERREQEERSRVPMIPASSIEMPSPSDPVCSSRSPV